MGFCCVLLPMLPRGEHLENVDWGSFNPLGYMCLFYETFSLPFCLLFLSSDNRVSDGWQGLYTRCVYPPLLFRWQNWLNQTLWFCDCSTVDLEANSAEWFLLHFQQRTMWERAMYGWMYGCKGWVSLSLFPWIQENERAIKRYMMRYPDPKVSWPPKWHAKLCFPLFGYVSASAPPTPWIGKGKGRQIKSFMCVGERSGAIEHIQLHRVREKEGQWRWVVAMGNGRGGDGHPSCQSTALGNCLNCPQEWASPA